MQASKQAADARARAEAKFKVRAEQQGEGATLKHPLWMDAQTGFQPFPVERVTT